MNEVWSKEYAKQVFEEAQSHPEVAELIENIKTKIQEKVDIEQLKELRETVKYMTGRSLRTPARGMSSESPMQVVEFVTRVLPDGRLSIPSELVDKLGIAPGVPIRVLLLGTA